MERTSRCEELGAKLEVVEKSCQKADYRIMHLLRSLKIVEDGAAQSSDDNKRPTFSVPPGHTLFSWLGQVSPPEIKVVDTHANNVNLPKLNPDEAAGVGGIEFRVGKIVKAWVHPESTNLYCEEIDVGEGELRSIASG